MSHNQFHKEVCKTWIHKSWGTDPIGKWVIGSRLILHFIRIYSLPITVLKMPEIITINLHSTIFVQQSMREDSYRLGYRVRYLLKIWGWHVRLLSSTITTPAIITTTPLTITTSTNSYYYSSITITLLLLLPWPWCYKRCYAAKDMNKLDILGQSRWMGPQQSCIDGWENLPHLAWWSIFYRNWGFP